MESQVNGELIQDVFGKWNWKTREGEIIPVSEMADSHLRNAALFLMGMGYTRCIANDRTRIMWLTVLRIEWERRIRKRTNGLVQWKVKDDKLESS